MRLMFRQAGRSIALRVAPPGATAEDRRKRIYVCLSLGFLVPIIMIFGIEDLRQGAVIEGSAVLSMALFLTITPFIMARLRDVMPLFRGGAFLTLLLQLYELAIGGGGGFAFLWFYCFPVLVLALFGKREGAGWVAAGLTSAAVVFLSPRSPYELETALRFLITYAVVGFFSYGLESTRDQFCSQLLAEKVALENALARVKTLRGLLPICTACNRVRDDRGYWQQLELYVGRHSDAEFSHGVCPACSERLYPGKVVRPESGAGE